MSVNDRVKIKLINEEETNGQSSPLTGDETTLPITRRVFDIYTDITFLCSPIQSCLWLFYVVQFPSVPFVL